MTQRAVVFYSRVGFLTISFVSEETQPITTSESRDPLYFSDWLFVGRWGVSFNMVSLFFPTSLVFFFQLTRLKKEAFEDFFKSCFMSIWLTCLNTSSPHSFDYYLYVFVKINEAVVFIVRLTSLIHICGIFLPKKQL